MTQKNGQHTSKPTDEMAGETHTITSEVRHVAEEVVAAPFRLRTYRLIRKILVGFIMVTVVNALFSYFFYTPKMYRINRDTREMIVKYRILQEHIRAAQREVEAIRHRDNFVYRSMFSTDSLSMPEVWQPYPESKYAALQGDGFSQLMIPTWQQLDALARSLYIESVSMDELQLLSQNKDKLATAIPAIWPIPRDALNGSLGAFNPRRFHPVLFRIQPHEGVDFGCDRGTEVYATGDGVVEKAIDAGFNGGYGKQVLIDHSFGYKTRYAHLNKVLVKEGDKVYRGQVIALSGNTGRTSGPHLHYEVIHRGTPVDPVNYFNREMTTEEYNQLMERMRDTDYERYDE